MVAPPPQRGSRGLIWREAGSGLPEGLILRAGHDAAFCPMPAIWLRNAVFHRFRQLEFPGGISASNFSQYPAASLYLLLLKLSRARQCQCLGISRIETQRLIDQLQGFPIRLPLFVIATMSA